MRGAATKSFVLFRQQLRKTATFDKAIVGLTIGGIVKLFHDADKQGREPLRGAVPARCLEWRPKLLHRTSEENGKGQTPATRGSQNTGRDYPKLSSTQCRLLEKQGYLVIDAFLSAQQVRDAQQTIRRLDADDQFQMSCNEKYEQDESSGKPVRTDRVLLHELVPSHSATDTSLFQMRKQETNDRRVEVSNGVFVDRNGSSTGAGLWNVQMELGRFARALADSDFNGFNGESAQDRYAVDKLRIPTQMQVSIFDHAEHKDEAGDYFTSHLDSAAGETLESLGILGWIRSRYVRKRYITCIVYLNSEWQEGDGGCIRLHDSEATMGTFESDSYKDFAPLAGRLVVFSSHTQWHAVLPTFVTRYACSLWLTLDDDQDGRWYPRLP